MQRPDDDGSDILRTGDLSGANVARLGVSNAAAALADRIIPLVSTSTDRHRSVTGLTREVLQARRIMNEVLARAVTADIMRGATMEDIADAFNVEPDIAVYQWGHLDWTHLADDPQGVWDALRPTCVAGPQDSCPSDPAEVARHLDDWCRRHTEDPREVAPGPARPVSAGLLP